MMKLCILQRMDTSGRTLSLSGIQRVLLWNLSSYTKWILGKMGRVIIMTAILIPITAHPILHMTRIRRMVLILIASILL